MVINSACNLFVLTNRCKGLRKMRLTDGVGIMRLRLLVNYAIVSQDLRVVRARQVAASLLISALERSLAEWQKVDFNLFTDLF